MGFWYDIVCLGSLSLSCKEINKDSFKNKSDITGLKRLWSLKIYLLTTKVILIEILNTNLIERSGSATFRWRQAFQTEKCTFN